MESKNKSWLLVVLVILTVCGLILGLVYMAQSLTKYNRQDIGLGVSNNDSLYGISDRLKIGTAIRAVDLNSTEYTKVFDKNFNLITPEYEMKWAFLEKQKNVYDFSKVDKMVEYASAHDKEIHGHTLVWHRNIPDWVEKYIESLSQSERRKALIKVLKDYIYTVVGRYKGKIATWDVVNEVLAQKESEAISAENPFRKDTILQKYIPDSNGNGIPDYIELAFQFAHEADPDAKLFYNDYAIEYLDLNKIADGTSNFEYDIKDKSLNAFKFVHDLIEAKVPIYGIGIQGHITMGLSTEFLDVESIEKYYLYKTLKQYDIINIHTRISESDVLVYAKEGTLPTEEDYFNQAATYSNYLLSCGLVESCDSFTVWQFSDNYIWYEEDFPGKKEEYYPNLFTRDYKPKQAYTALAVLLRSLVK